MKKPLFILLVGNIGSGKSTLCKLLAKKNFTIISRDALRYMIGGGDYRFDPKMEPYIAEAHDAMLQCFLSGVSYGSPENLDIVVDEVNVQASRRDQLLEMISDDDCSRYIKVAIVLPKLSKKKSVDRRMKNEHGKFGRKVWEGVWEKFDKAYSEPYEDKGYGFDHVMFLKSSKDVAYVPTYLENIRKRKCHE
jgi:predicted kinase